MKSYADTGFLASLYLPESTTPSAHAAVKGLANPLTFIALGALELRNAFNLAIVRKRITVLERDALWSQFESHVAAGIFEEKRVPTTSLHNKARKLSDAYTPIYATRSLDLLHVAAALLLGAGELFSFDKRQREVAVAEGLNTRP
jgi:predicted nucleic acid-binding protein